MFRFHYNSLYIGLTTSSITLINQCTTFIHSLRALLLCQQGEHWAVLSESRLIGFQVYSPWRCGDPENTSDNSDIGDCAEKL